MPVALLVTLYLDAQIMGRAELRSIDRSMGVYGGRLEPTEAFEQIQPIVKEVIREMYRWPTDEAKLQAAYARRDALGLTVRTASGAVLNPLTLHVDREDSEYHLQLLGLSWEEAERYFDESAA